MGRAAPRGAERGRNTPAWLQHYDQFGYFPDFFSLYCWYAFFYRNVTLCPTSYNPVRHPRLPPPVPSPERVRRAGPGGETVWESEDAEGKRGVRLSKDIVKVAGRTQAVASCPPLLFLGEGECVLVSRL